ncbi:MAG: alpha/beta fold hydrolase [Legionellaceae bacterium]|nr:alpha/beta fold hydrolase [Legionellaceae bacterium]
MDLDAFRCMRQGKAVAQISAADTEGMRAVDIQRPASGGRALLMLHGFTSTPAVYRYFLPHLTQYERIVVPLLPGHGESLTAFARVKAQDWLSAVERECARLQQEYRQVDVLGLSLGGLLACHLARQFSLHHLYLLSPALDLVNHLNRSLTLAKFCQFLGFHALRSASGNIYQAGQCEISYKKIPLSSLIEVLSLIRDFSFQLPTCPCDVFVGRHDAVVDSHKVAARFSPFVDMRVHWLAHSAHVLPLDGDREYILHCLNGHNHLLR